MFEKDEIVESAFRLLTAKYFTNRKITPKFIILHHTDSLTDASDYLAHAEPGHEVSVHLHVNRIDPRADSPYHGKGGVITRYTNLIDLDAGWAKDAWHAGTSSWRYKGASYVGLNSYSVGIEIDGDGKVPFTDAQMASVRYLCRRLMSVFSIPAECILGHREIAPRRKTDPAPFDLDAFRKEMAVPTTQSVSSAEPPAWWKALKALYGKAQKATAAGDVKVDLAPADLSGKLNDIREELPPTKPEWLAWWNQFGD